MNLVSWIIGTLNHNILWFGSQSEPHFFQSYRPHCHLNRSDGRSQIVTAGGVTMQREESCKSLVINGVTL